MLVRVNRTYPKGHLYVFSSPVRHFSIIWTNFIEIRSVDCEQPTSHCRWPAENLKFKKNIQEDNHNGELCSIWRSMNIWHRRLRGLSICRRNIAMQMWRDYVVGLKINSDYYFVVYLYVKGWQTQISNFLVEQCRKISRKQTTTRRDEVPTFMYLAII